MASDSTLLLLDTTALTSANDGTGTGTAPGTAPGAVINVPEGGLIGIKLILGEATGTIATDADTLDTTIEITADGGSTWATFITFRQFVGSEINKIDTSTGSPTLRRGAIAYLPRADADQAGVLQMRPKTVVSAARSFAVHLEACDPNEIPADWLTDNIVA